MADKLQISGHIPLRTIYNIFHVLLAAVSFLSAPNDAHFRCFTFCLLRFLYLSDFSTWPDADVRSARISSHENKQTPECAGYFLSSFSFFEEFGILLLGPAASWPELNGTPRARVCVCVCVLVCVANRHFWERWLVRALCIDDVPL